MAYSRLIGALLRHIFAFMLGENIDGESKKKHLAHAGCCLLMLMEMDRHHPNLDDRQSKFIENLNKGD